MVLGELIEFLEGVEDKSMEVKLQNFHSYRGFYNRLAVEEHVETVSVQYFLEEALDCVDRVFEGYKGGDFVMKPETPIYVADYGCTSGLGLAGFEESMFEPNLLVHQTFDVDAYELYF